jgi:hypothetical protein
MSGFRCGVIAVAIGIVGIAATFTLAVASRCVGATVDFNTDSDTDLDETMKPNQTNAEQPLTGCRLK